MEFLGWLGQPGNTILIPLFAAVIPVLGALAVALIGMLTKDWQLRRLDVLEKLISLSEESPDIDRLQLEKIVRFEVSAEIRARRLSRFDWRRISFSVAGFALILTLLLVIFSRDTAPQGPAVFWTLVATSTFYAAMFWYLFQVLVGEERSGGRRGKFLPPAPLSMKSRVMAANRFSRLFDPFNILDKLIEWARGRYGNQKGDNDSPP